MPSCSEPAAATTLRLCYVEGAWAWFTSDFENQWGDDWNDAPYEHNAGEPYEWRPYMAERGREQYELLRVAWWHPSLLTPSDIDPPNSAWSVEQINAGHVAWLSEPNYGKRPRIIDPVIYGGATLDEFTAAIEERGGTVYLPKEVEARA